MRYHQIILLALLCSSPVLAQEPINASDAGTSPAPGRIIVKERFRFHLLDLNTSGRNAGTIRDYTSDTSVNIGLTRDLSLTVQALALFRDRTRSRGRDDSTFGVADPLVALKYRFWQNDSSGLNTERAVVSLGARIRSGDQPFTSDATSPVLGLAYTRVLERHGFNAALQWTATTGGSDEPIYPGMSTADLIRYDLAYLYRLAPAAFSAETQGGWYAMLEANGFYETNGDHELLLAPGIMYEAATWTAELSVQVPVHQRVDHRAEHELVVTAGLRLSF